MGIIILMADITFLCILLYTCLRVKSLEKRCKNRLKELENFMSTLDK